MAYRAIVSIEFDDEDLEELAGWLGVDTERLNPTSAVEGALDSIEIGSCWVEQLFKDGHPQIARLSGGIMVEINEHDS